MVASMSPPLGINTNKENILNPHEQYPLPTPTGFREGFLFPDDPSSVLSVGSLNIHNDENKYPLEMSPLFPSNHSPTNAVKAGDKEMANLKTELEATRRRLAEYEGRGGSNVPPSVKSSTPSRSPVTSSSSSTFDYGYNDILPWSDYDSLSSEVPSAPHPTAMDYTTPVPPLRLPSTSLPFHPGNPGSSITPGSIISTTVLITGNAFSVREDIRSVSLPMPGPIGEPRKMPSPQRAFPGDYKNFRDKEPWKPEPEWTPWPGVPVVNPPRQLTGTASLGMVFNDQSAWPDVTHLFCFRLR
jgi:hypothetical protein